MRIYKAKNGKTFRLAGLELTERGDILTIFWIETSTYEERFFGEVESYLLPFDYTQPVSIFGIVKEKKKRVTKVVTEKKVVVKKPKPANLELL
jgi:hypothetical protein